VHRLVDGVVVFLVRWDGRTNETRGRGENYVLGGHYSTKTGFELVTDCAVTVKANVAVSFGRAMYIKCLMLIR